jgi:hypothetical protein
VHSKASCNLSNLAMPAAIVDEKLRAAIVKYSKANTYVAAHFAQSQCSNKIDGEICGGEVFSVLFDDTEGCAARTCVACEDQQAIADGEEYLDEAELETPACPCGTESFTIVVGAALYDGSTDVKWCYLGLRCTACKLAAVYGDWKCEAGDVKAFLALV